MSLILYRRHRKHCEADHPEDTRSGEFEEGRRGWKKCACRIHASGTLGRKFSRKQIGTSDWVEAKTVAGALERAGAWDGEIEPLPTPVPATVSVRITIADAIKVFLSKHEGAKIAAATLRKYKTFTKQLVDFADSRGYVMLDQFTSADMDVFYGNWKLRAREGQAPRNAQGVFPVLHEPEMAH